MIKEPHNRLPNRWTSPKAGVLMLLLALWVYTKNIIAATQTAHTAAMLIGTR